MLRINPVILFIFLMILSGGCIRKPSGTGDHGKFTFLSEEHFKFLEKLTKDVIDSSRISPGEKVVENTGPNNTGGILIRPGGRSCYPAFWIRDYAMSLETGFITPEEQKHMLKLVASTQCDQTWITKGGSIIPYGAIADHIRIDDGLPVYFPGTLGYDDQGNKKFGIFPPYDDQYYFIHIVWYYAMTTGDKNILKEQINYRVLSDRLISAFHLPPSHEDNHLVYTTDDFRGVDFGFRDVITMTGDLCFTSILKCRAASEMADLMKISGNLKAASRYTKIAESIKSAIPSVFLNEKGILRASTGKSSQPDVWASGLAVYYGILEGETAGKVCRVLTEAYQKGELTFRGNIRHILITDDFSDSTAWEHSLASKNTYQNGAYWGTPTGWICYAISRTDPEAARKLAAEFVLELIENDFRKGSEYGSPYECFHSSGFRQNPVYMASVTCPYIVFKNLK